MKTLCLLPMLAAGAALEGQTTQGLISGRILNLNNGVPVGGALVSWVASESGLSGAAYSQASGYYVLPLLSPGKYRVRVVEARYQAQEIYDLELRVAARLDIVFRLRPLSDVWDRSHYHSLVLPDSESLLRFFGPDVDLSRSGSFEPAHAQSGVLETAVSSVVGPPEIQHLPLDGRDVYAALVLQPNVAADTGTARGLGISVSGQRPSASNYLLDGVENNDYLLTGPLTIVVPEAVQEYRISTANYSAEYGHTAGFIANAVTRSGGNAWHGAGYFNLKNAVLDANSFQNNLTGAPRIPDLQQQPGAEVGGPLLAGRLFEFAGLDYLRNRSALDPVQAGIPTRSFISSLPADSLAKGLLETYAPPAAVGSGESALMTFRPPASINRYVGIERLDFVSRDGRQRGMARLAVSKTERPDFVWSPYSDFTSGLGQTSANLALSWVSTVRPDMVNEARAGFSWESFGWGQRHPEIPALVTYGPDGSPILLPGSPGLLSYDERNRAAELSDSLQWSRGRHVFKAGGGALLRTSNTNLNDAGSGKFTFSNLDSFAAGEPSSYDVAVNRAGLADNPTVPQFARAWRYNQYFAFAQYSLKATHRLALNFGVRFEAPGRPVNRGPVKDAFVALGAGSSLPEKLEGATLVFPASGDQPVYVPNHTWAPRFGFSYSLDSAGSTVLRGGYGIFYDRPFDNLWQSVANNNFIVGDALVTDTKLNYLLPPQSLLTRLAPLTPALNRLTLFQPELPNGYSQTFFVGMEKRIGGAVSLEANGSGALGRKLITTDLVNRDFSLPSSEGEDLPLNQNLPSILYRGSQGKSDYFALNVVARYRSRHGFLQAAYTWSHSIDNQSDPLLGETFNLSIAGFSSGASNNNTAEFTRQFDSQGNRGNSDFDQRHNLVLYSSWELPAVAAHTWMKVFLKDWRAAETAAFRSGFPYSVYGVNMNATAPGGLLNQDPVQLTGVTPVYIDQPIPGGRQLLNPLAFAQPFGLGNTSRNEFHGPGVFNIDLSLSRSFALPWPGEAARITLRADAYNFLNHANLNSPGTVLFGFPGFGQATYGRVEQNASFPSVTPFAETPRQVQLLLKLAF